MDVSPKQVEEEEEEQAECDWLCFCFFQFSIFRFFVFKKKFITKIENRKRYGTNTLPKEKLRQEANVVIQKSILIRRKDNKDNSMSMRYRNPVLL